MASAADIPPSFAHLRVLLIDDGAHRTRLIREQLVRQGHEVVGVIDSATLIHDCVQRLQPDVVVVDTESPTRDTLEKGRPAVAGHRLRSQRRLPVAQLDHRTGRRLRPGARRRLRIDLRGEGRDRPGLPGRTRTGRPRPRERCDRAGRDASAAQRSAPGHAQRRRLGPDAGNTLDLPVLRRRLRADAPRDSEAPLPAAWNTTLQDLAERFAATLREQGPDSVACC